MTDFSETERSYQAYLKQQEHVHTEKCRGGIYGCHLEPQEPNMTPEWKIELMAWLVIAGMIGVGIFFAWTLKP